MVCLLAVISVVSGCGRGYEGKYLNVSGTKYIEIEGNSIYVSSTDTSNAGLIEKVTKSNDGKTVTLEGYLDYSGGSGSAFGVTVTAGNERHWEKPFTATIDTSAGNIQFRGTLIIDSMTYQKLSWDFKKE